MWYVIQVKSGLEENIMMQCRKRIGESDCEGGILRRCFIPYYERKRKYQGSWHTEQHVLFPGYVFLVSDNPKALFLKLKQVQGLTRMLGTGQEIVSLSSAEVSLLLRLGGDSQMVLSSVGVIEKDQIRITQGPLQGLEGCIRRIDRHKRLAWIEIEMMGRTMEARVGLEVVEKR